MDGWNLGGLLADINYRHCTLACRLQCSVPQFRVYSNLARDKAVVTCITQNIIGIVLCFTCSHMLINRSKLLSFVRIGRHCPTKKHDTERLSISLPNTD